METDAEFRGRVARQGYLTHEESLERDRRTGLADDPRYEESLLSAVLRAALAGDSEAARWVLARPGIVVCECCTDRLRAVAAAGMN